MVIMALPTIFCPQCDALILDSVQCSNCHWQRPSTSGDIGQPAWAVALGAKLPSRDSHPVAHGHFVYFSTDNSQIVALDVLEAEPEQVVKWKHQIDTRYRCHSLAVWDKSLLLGNEFLGGFPTPPGELILLHALDGEEVWRHAVEGASLSVPVVKENIAYFTVNSGWLYAVNLETRQEAWRKKIPSPWSWSPAPPVFASNGLLVLPSRTDNLVAFNLETGDNAWSFSGGGWFAYSPICKDNTVYVRCWDKHIYALNQDNGQEIWRYKAPRDFSSDLFVNKDYLYIGAKDYKGDQPDGGSAYALYVLNRHSGERVNRLEIEGHVFGRPVANDTAVFFTSDDKSRVVPSGGTLYGFNATVTEMLWEPAKVEQRFQSDLVLAGNFVVAGSRQGAVYGVPWQGEETLTESPQTYVDAGEWQKAAITFALQGDLDQAAKIFADSLNQPVKAGQLYLQAGQPQQVVKLLGQSENENARVLAFKAIEAIDDVNERAIALVEMGEYLGAANIYIQHNEYEKAGDCYLEARAWQEAQDAYSKAEVWDKWEKLVREQEQWQDLIEHFVLEGKYTEAAEVQLGRGNFLEAAAYFEQADMPAEALDAYNKVPSDQLTEDIQLKILELAKTTGDQVMAFEVYLAMGKLVEAAQLAEESGHFNKAFELFRDAGEPLKAAAMLQKTGRYAEAASMFEQARAWGQAAESLEQQTEQEIEGAGGLRFLQETDHLEEWLNRAITLYEEEADYADEGARADFFAAADRCRVSLMRIKREPLLRLNLQADRLVYNQGNAVHYTVENVGWGTARNVKLSISGPNLTDDQLHDLGTLGRRQKAEGVATIVPTLVGEIMLQVDLLGQSKSGDLQESLTQTMAVVQEKVQGGPGVSVNTQIGRGAGHLHNVEAPIADRGSLWSDSTASPSAVFEAPVSKEQLVQQRIESLRRQLAQHYANLNKLQEQAAAYGAGMAPLQLQNSIDNEQRAVDEIEDTLAELEA